ncbi:DNA cytosine methyltransferase [Candidatus Margulisiibacteriota bacterium]
MLKFIDLFCGIGGFRYAIKRASNELGLISKCLFSSDIDVECQKTYFNNFLEKPFGDISKIDDRDIPDHDILLAGFPCQPFSIIGQGHGFDDSRGTLFFEISRILAKKKPKAFVLENVKRLVSHNNGHTMKNIIQTLKNVGYHVSYKVLNALDFGLPQKRERVFIVGVNKAIKYTWPKPNIKMKPLEEILEKEVDKKYYVSKHIRDKRFSKKKPTKNITIWHENKSGNICAYPYSCALRAGASYNYLLVNGIRRLTDREMLRLQGFPDNFKIVSSYTNLRKQAGNSLPIPVAQAVIKELLVALNCD